MEATEMTKRAVLYARVCVDDGQNLAEQLETHVAKMLDSMTGT
jgi:hypothetical protein